MKRSLLILGLTALNAFAQDKAPLPPAEPIRAVPAVEPAPAPPAKPLPRVPTKVKRIEAIAAPNAMAQAATALDVAKSQVAAAGKSFRTFEFDNVLPRSTKTGRTLVVQSVDTDPTAIANAEEDLSVMALILRKATGGSSSEDKRMALGVEVDSTIFGSSSGARNIYVEGYGALFLLGVRYPLIAPQDKPDEPQAKDERSNDWKEAREEYLAGGRLEIDEEFQGVWKGGGRGGNFGGEDYDADKVEGLKVALLESLKNANHIRILKPTEYVNVVIQGGEARIGEKTVTTRGGQVNVTVRSKVSGRSDSRRGETVMTLRVKKSDVDAFAAGTLDYAGFRNKATIQTYLRRGDASVSTSPFRAQ